MAGAVGQIERPDLCGTGACSFAPASPGQVQPGGTLDGSVASPPAGPDAGIRIGSEVDATGVDDTDGAAVESAAPDSAGLDGNVDDHVDASPNLASPYGPNLISIFDGASLAGWTVVVDGKVTNADPLQWSVVNGALHSSGANRNFIYTASQYEDFRLIFTSRLISDLADGNTPHVPCVLFWGTSTTSDAMDALQVQPPKGYMWDYRQTGPTANKSPSVYTRRRSPTPICPTQNGANAEMLANKAAGTMRFACCQVTGSVPCKATEIVDFKDPTAGQTYYLAFQVHTGNNGTATGQIEEFKDIYVESPVADPQRLVTTQ